MSLNSNKKCILFDLDGTLIDHFTCLYHCFSYVIEKFGEPKPDFPTVKTIIGGGLRKTLGSFIGSHRIDKGLEYFFEKYDDIALKEYEILEGAHWILQNLKDQGYRIAIMTNKTGFRARTLCQHVGFTNYTTDIFGEGDTPYVKPEKGFSDYVLSQLNTPPENTILIGDTMTDIETALYANMTSLIVTTGSKPRSFFEENSPKAHKVYSNLFELGKDYFNLTIPNEILLTNSHTK